MADAALAAGAPAGEEAAPKKGSKLPLLIGLVLALALGGGGFYAVYSGLLFGAGEEAGEGKAAEGHGRAEGEAGGEGAPEALPDIAFVPVPAMVISLGGAASARHLRFTAQIEVAKAQEPEVALLMPRIQDVLNTYLRAVDIHDLEDPSALVRLRAQMLRRVQIVAGEGRVRDFLVTEFVLN